LKYATIEVYIWDFFNRRFEDVKKIQQQQKITLSTVGMFMNMATINSAVSSITSERIVSRIFKHILRSGKGL